MQEQKEKKRQKFGTFAGVFTPSVLTILGVIMFLRAGYVTGNAGWKAGLLIVTISVIITALTSLSVSVIATNTRVKGGGAYYMISRSLGPEFGGAIGIALYLAQGISVALYTFGFTEALMDAWPGNPLSFKWTATIVALILFFVTFIGADFSIKIQFYIMGALAVSLISFYAGAIPKFNPAYLAQNAGAGYLNGANFWTMLALFFPAATGFMAGVGMSGDLEKPGRSIPQGTMWAVGSTYFIYLSFVFLLGAVFPRETLLTDNLTVKRISAVPFLIDIGMYSATLSSAMGSFLGAPRVLQQLARDRIWPGLDYFGKGSGPNDEPRTAVIITGILALLCIWITDLNIIAPIVTMFFMITYGLTNLAAFYESYGRNPSFRPTFKYFHFIIGIVGFILCLGVMMLISYTNAIMAILVFFGMYKYIERANVNAAFGDAKFGFLFFKARSNLLALQLETEHVKNWRPRILIVNKNRENLSNLIRHGNWLEGHRGILTVAEVIEGSIEERLTDKEKREEELEKYIQDNRLQVFPEVVLAESFDSGVRTLLQAYSIGKIKPNTLLLEWPLNIENMESCGKVLRDAYLLHKNILILKENKDRDQETDLAPSLIDIWWRGEENGNLMLLFAYLLKQNPLWRQSRIRILRPVEDDGEKEVAEKEMHELITETRIPAEPVAVQAYGIAGMKEKINQLSRDSDIVFLGMTVPEEGREQIFMEGFMGLLENVPTAVLVKSFGKTDIRV